MRTIGVGGVATAKRALAALVLVSIWVPVAPCRTAEGGAAGTSRNVRGERSWSDDDDRLLEDASRRAFLFFWEQSDPDTGLAPDRARFANEPIDEGHKDVASIAATGFGLSAIAIAAERGWVPEADARERVRATLRFFADRAPRERGWFYHWMNAKTGKRVWQSELSSIDSALLLAGILTVRTRFASDAEIVRLATKIYDRVDFRWMLNGDPLLLSHGWYPNKGFIPSRWDHYCELMILYALAIGSRTHAIPAKSWYAWTRPTITYAGYTYVNQKGDPLFVQQFSHAWIDFRGRREKAPTGVDWFENSVAATRAHRQFCVDLKPKFPGYSENVWGVTASDGPKGYTVWSGPPLDPQIDGTVVPYAAGGSLAFTPDISIPALREMKERFGDKVYGRYGYADAFNPTTGWVGPDYIGIDVGITVLAAENLRTGAVWRWFMANPEIANALDRVGLVARKK